MKKWLTMLFALMLMVGLLAACGPEDTKKEGTSGDDGKSEAAGEMPEKPEKLKLWVNAEEKQEEAVKQITDKYTDKVEKVIENKEKEVMEV